MNIKLKEVRQDGIDGGTLRIVVDGFNAPITAGNFVDLVQRGFYNNMEIQRADGFVVQTGDPGPPVNPDTPLVLKCPYEIAGLHTACKSRTL
jgi:cyclophilin family peptidyl-prolyl cis-trans isomerase